MQIFPKKDKAWVNLLGGILFLIPWTVLIIFWSFDYAQLSWTVREGSPDPGGLPARYIIKFAVPLGMFLLLLQAISMVIKSVFTLKNWSYSSMEKQD
jgi:TRAP-type mannitol/chloroaromatic compound transport system permease small subunit